MMPTQPAPYCLLAAFLSVTGCDWVRSPAPDRSSRPNVLLITLDTVRADHLSCYDAAAPPTPALDALARRGARLAWAFAQAPLTAPSHASILTGTHPAIHGIRDNGGFALASGIPTLASLASDAGYETSAFVAAAVLDRRFGLDRGFRHYADTGGPPDAEVPPGAAPEIRGHVVTDRALAWLAGAAGRGVGSGDRPFLAWVHYFDAHAPYDPPSPFRERYQERLYAGEVAAVDLEVGRLLGGLEAQGVLGRTLVVAVGDHGEGLGDHGEFTHGVFLYDATVHIPAIIAGPGVAGGRVVHDLARSIDILPTLADLAGFSPGPLAQGMSLRPALDGRPVRTVFAFAETHYPRTNLGWADLRAVRTEEHKLILAPRPELYLLSVDPDEACNVYSRYPVEVARLKALATAVSASVSPSTAPLSLPPEAREQLRALGYVSAGPPADERSERTLPDPKDRVAVLHALERSEQAIQRRDYAAAAAVLETTLAEDPSNPALHGHLIHCYERLGDPRNAIRAARAAIEHGAAAVDTWARLGSHLLIVGDVPGAAAALEKALDLGADDPRVDVNLATAALELGRLDQAERVASAALERRAALGEAWNVLGIVAVRRGRPQEARQRFRRALADDPRLADPYLNLGLLAEQSGRRDEASQLYRAFLDRADRRERAAQVAQVEAALSRLAAGP